MLTAYEVAVKVSLINGVTSGLMGMASQFAKVHGDVDKLQSKLDKIKLTMMTGALWAGAGAMGFAALSKTIDPASQLTHELVQMNLAGMKSVEVAQALKFAWASAYTVPTATTMDMLATTRELRMVLGDTQHAIEAAPILQKMQYVLVNAGKMNPERAHEEALIAARALEKIGAVKDAKDLFAQADLMTKAIVASGGKLTASDFRSGFIYGRVAAQGWENEFKYKILPTAITETKGKSSGGQGGPGNSLMTAYNLVVSGRGTKAALEEAARLKLLDPDKIEYSKSGEIKGIKPGGFRGWEKFVANPFTWFGDLDRRYTELGLSPAERLRSEGILFQVRTASDMASQMTNQRWKFERDVKLINQAQGIGAYETLIKQDPAAAKAMLSAQWQSLLATLGYEIMPYVVS